MSEILTRANQILAGAGFAVEPAGFDETAFLFEDSTVIGFAFEFTTPTELIQTWQARLSSTTKTYQFAIRRSQEKSWNAYALLLCGPAATESEKVLLQTIEEDLSGTRKIVRSDLPDLTSVIQALLPLLPLQRAPELPAVDMEAEIRLRASELPDDALRAFFSEAADSIALQVIEEAS